jgi:hypothetical protein
MLYVGEGRHDIGPDPINPPRAASGPIPTLVRKIQPGISANSIALAWRELHRFHPNARKRGYPAKVAAAGLLAERKFDCEGCIFVADRDREKNRQARLEEAVQSAPKWKSTFWIVVGIAVESVEAWTLGAPIAIAQVLGVEEKNIRELYPTSHVESLYDNSGKEEHWPKKLLQTIAALNDEVDCLEFRTRIAEATQIADLEKACPNGFAPFARVIRNRAAV